MYSELKVNAMIKIRWKTIRRHLLRGKQDYLRRGRFCDKDHVRFYIEVESKR